jgi:hypothetical protein
MLSSPGLHFNAWARRSMNSDRTSAHTKRIDAPPMAME